MCGYQRHPESDRPLAQVENPMDPDEDEDDDDEDNDNEDKRQLA